jgi:hypothetical protein
MGCLFSVPDETYFSELEEDTPLILTMVKPEPVIDKMRFTSNKDKHTYMWNKVENGYQLQTIYEE